MDFIDRKITQLASQRGTIGSFLSRVNVAISNLQVSAENYISAASRITDSDVASDSAELVRSNILQQGAAAVLAQSNQQPAIALQLLRS
jgi:flagellin